MDNGSAGDSEEAEVTPYELYHGDCLEVMRGMPDNSVEAVVTDPPYAEIDRKYGRLTETKWHTLMDATVAEVRRILKPNGSAVFIMQPNSERVGRMRLWVFRFIVKHGESWNLVQDAWWWNYLAFRKKRNSFYFGMKITIVLKMQEN